MSCRSVVQARSPCKEWQRAGVGMRIQRARTGRSHLGQESEIRGTKAEPSEI